MSKMTYKVPAMVVVLVSLLTSIASADEMVLLNDGAQAAICHAGNLILVDPVSGKFQILDKASRVVDDPLNGWLLAAHLEKGGTKLALFSSKEGFRVLQSARIALQVDDLYWSGVAGKFYLCASPIDFHRGDIPFWSCLSIAINDDAHKFDADPVPGLSDIISYAPADSLAVNVSEPGCFAYSAAVSHPQIFVDTQPPSTRPSQMAPFFVITKAWRPWKAFAIMGGPTADRPVRFSADGKSLLARLLSAHEMDYRIVDLADGSLGRCDWLVPASELDIAAASGDLTQEIAVMELTAPGEEPTPASMQLTDALGYKRATAPGSPQQCLLLYFAKGQQAKLLGTYNVDRMMNLIGAYSGKQKMFIVTDGERVLRISGGNIISEKTLRKR